MTSNTIDKANGGRAPGPAPPCGVWSGAGMTESCPLSPRAAGLSGRIEIDPEWGPRFGARALSRPTPATAQWLCAWAQAPSGLQGDGGAARCCASFDRLRPGGGS
jgi:hypothetical protein